MYDAPATVAPILLALVLVVSGLAKLVNLSTAADAFVSLRLPPILLRLRAPQILPFAELALAAALLVSSGPVAVLVAVAALGVFVAYLVVILRALTFDEKVTCSCFGKLGLGAVDRFTAGRNALLVVLAVLTLVDAAHGRSVASRLAHFTGGQWLWLTGVFAAIALTWLITGDRGSASTTSNTVAPTTEEGEYLRAPIPFGRLRRPDNSQVSFRVLAESEAALLLYVSPTCGSCADVIAEARTWQRETNLVHTYLVLPMAPTTTPHGLPDPEDFDLLFDPASEMYNLFRSGTPTAVLLGADGYLAGGPVVGSTAISELMDGIRAELSDEAPRPAPVAVETSTTPAAPAPPATPATASSEVANSEPEGEALDYVRHPTPYGLLERPDGTGVPLVSLADDAPTILLFVSPSCSPCHTIIEKAPRWRELLDSIRVAFVVGDASALPRLEEVFGGDVGEVYVDPQGRVSQTFAAGNPGMVALGPDRLLLAGPVTGTVDIDQAMAEIVEQVTGIPAETTADPVPASAQPARPREFAPSVELTRRDGSRVDMRHHGKDRQQLLAFLSPECEACIAMADHIPTWRAQLPDVDIVVVAYGEPADEVEPVRSFRDVLFDTTGAFGDALDLLTPALMLVGKDGTIAGGPVSGLVECEEFVVRIRGMYANLSQG